MLKFKKKSELWQKIYLLYLNVVLLLKEYLLTS
mgnify:CR=1 FL=1